MPPISTSSPGSNPSASSAVITPMRRSRCSTCASASSFSRSWRAIRRSTASPVTRNSPAPVRCDLEAAARGRAEDLELGDLALAAPRRRTSGSATGTRRSSSRASSSRPWPRRARGHEHGRVEARAPLRRRRLGRLGRDEVGLREREDARQLGQPRVVLGQLGLDHAWLSTGSEPSSGARSSTWTSSRVRSTWARKSWPRPAPSRGALDQARDVGDHELAVVGVERAEHRLERRERVGGDLRRGAREARAAATTCRRWAARRGRRRRAA